MGSRKNIKQEKNKGSREVFNTVEGDTWERKENLKNAEELIEEFERGEVVVRRQVEEEGEYKRMELPGKYMAKLLYRWDDRRFEEEYLNKLEKNWKKWRRKMKK